MNEQNEISGDLQDEYLAIQAADAAERDDCNSNAPEPTLTDEDLDDWAARTDAMNDLLDEVYPTDAPDLVEDPDRPGHWRFHPSIH